MGGRVVRPDVTRARCSPPRCLTSRSTSAAEHSPALSWKPALWVPWPFQETPPRVEPNWNHLVLRRLRGVRKLLTGLVRPIGLEPITFRPAWIADALGFRMFHRVAGHLAKNLSPVCPRCVLLSPRESTRCRKYECRPPGSP